jgi:hypothetical protein
MGTIHVFGDSYTQGHNLDFTHTGYIKWKEFRGGNLPPTWVDLLGKKMGMDIKNTAIGGNCNNRIFDDVCVNSDKFKKDDIIIIGWTYRHRLRWASLQKHQDGRFVDFDKNGEPCYVWRRLSIDDSSPQDDLYIKKELRHEIISNQLQSPYIDEIYNREKIIEQLSKSVGFELYFWSSDASIIYDLPEEKLNQKKYIIHNIIDKNVEGYRKDFFNTIKIYGGQTISEETNSIIKDGHLGESGHRVQFELFYEYIVNLR